jgi:Holliday junction resolvase-like predicted endonuclease
MIVINFNVLIEQPSGQSQNSHNIQTQKATKSKQEMYKTNTNKIDIFTQFTKTRKNIKVRNRATSFLKTNMEAITRKHSVDLLQQTATLGTSHKIGK